MRNGKGMRYRGWISFLALLILAGCTVRPELPPISESGTHSPGKIVWRDLLTSDVDEAGRFYEQLLGWETERLSDGYRLILFEGRPIGGIARKDDDETAAQWVPFMSVADVDRAVGTVEASGSEVYLSPIDLPKRGTLALVADPQGAAFGVMRSEGGDPADRKAAIGDWLWNELWLEDPDAVLPFYQKLAGLRPESVDADGVDYRFLESDGVPRAGLVKRPESVIRNTWVNYVRVEDPSDMARRAEALGGRVLMAPRPDVRRGSVAIIADPTGGAILLQKWPV